MRLPISFASVLLCLLVAQPAHARGPEVGDSVQAFRLRTINAKAAGVSYLSLLDHVGSRAKTPKKLVLLSFFATYCGPCKKELPFLAALDEAYRDKGLQVVSVTIDKDKAEVDKAAALAKKHGVAFPVVSDRFNIVAKRWGIEKLPCVYIIDPAGNVTLKKVGYKGQVTKELFDAVRAALGEPDDAPVPTAVAKHMKH